MKKEILYESNSAYREPFLIPGFRFGGEEKTFCIVGSLRGNEIQQLYICSRLVKRFKELEEQGRIRKNCGILVIPCANISSMNIGKRFWAMDNSDINRMFPGYDLGETTQRIASGIFKHLQGFKYGVQFSSFYIPGQFVTHVRMMETSYADMELARLFGLPFVVLRKPLPYDTTTLNFNWQVWDTKAFSIYSSGTDSIDEKEAMLVESAILRFLSRMHIIDMTVHAGYESTVIDEDGLLTIRADAAGIYIPCVTPFDEVSKGQVLGRIVDSLTGEICSEVRSPNDGIVFFKKQAPLVMEHDSLFKIITGLHK